MLEHSRGVFSVPLVEKVSSFKPGPYMSLLMPAENKPLEAGILKRVKELLTEVDARTTAWHITKVDCMVGAPTSLRHKPPPLRQAFPRSPVPTVSHTFIDIQYQSNIWTHLCSMHLSVF